MNTRKQEVKSPASTELSMASKGGRARAASLSSKERVEIARKAALARWGSRGNDDIPEEIFKKLPVAAYRGVLNLVGPEIPCYVLSDGQRVIGRTSATEMLTNIKGGGSLEKYMGVKSLKPFIDHDSVVERMIAFRLPEVEGLGRTVKGLPADLLIEICRGFVDALNAHNNPSSPFPKLTPRQTQMALRASIFLAACAKVGLDALIDEATGYQYDRITDALQVKLKAYLSEEVRQWEKTFPDELWREFARLTGWKGSVTKRPKYWGKLVMELIYEYLDPDVAEWLKDHAPEPRHGRNYHQWLSDQYGLPKLVEHIWMVIGMAKASQNMPELKQRMAEQFGRVPIQLMLYFPPPAATGTNKNLTLP